MCISDLHNTCFYESDDRLVLVKVSACLAAVIAQPLFSLCKELHNLQWSTGCNNDGDEDTESARPCQCALEHTQITHIKPLLPAAGMGSLHHNAGLRSS